MNKTIAATILAAFFAALPTPAEAAPKPPVRACEYEDSINCVWDAVHMGNGFGKSFRVNHKGKVKYISHRRAHRLINR